MRVPRCFLAVLAVLAFASAVVEAQQNSAGIVRKNVTAVRLEVEGRPIVSPQLLSLVDVRTGEPLQLGAVRSSENRLLTVGGFEDVRVVANDSAAGLEIVFQLQPRHPIEAIAFRGDTGLSAGRLEDLVDRQYGDSALTTPRRLIVALVLSELQGEGFAQAVVTSDVELTHSPERATMALQIQAGPRSMIRSTSVRLTGVSSLTESSVVAQTDTEVGQPYRPQHIDEKLSEIRDKLRSKQQYDAAASFEPKTDGQYVDVQITIDAGARVVLEAAGDPWPLGGDWEDYTDIARLRSADNDLLEDANFKLVAALRRGGYRDAQVTHTRTAREGETLITFTFAVGPKSEIDRVELSGNPNMPATLTPRVIGLMPGTVFADAQIVAAAGRIRAEYRLHGFHAVLVEPSFVELVEARTKSTARMLVRITIVEGPAATIRDIVFGNPPALPEAVVRDVLRSKVGAPYVDAERLGDQAALATLLRNEGYLSAAPVIIATPGDAGRAMTLTIDTRAGAQVILADIRVVGNQKVKEEAILQEMTLKVGEPFGEAKRVESQRRLVETGLFRRVTFTQEPLAAGATRARLLVSVEEARSTTYTFGGGLEAPLRQRHAIGGGLEERREFSPRASFDVTRRNLFGKNQSINFFSRVSFTPKTSDDPLLDGHGVGFSDYRVATSYRDAHAFKTIADIVLGASSEQGLRPAYNYLRRSLSLEAVRPISGNMALSGRYALEFTRTFDSRIPEEEQPVIDRLLPGVRLSIVSSGFTWDRRDNVLSPTRGTFVSADGEIALQAIGSEVGYTKAFMQASLFRSLNTSHPFVLATRIQFGIARGFQREVPVVDENGNPALGPDGQPLTQLVADLPASQRFYAGGSTTVRGFAQDRLGEPSIITASGLSVGGSGLVVLNAELRTNVGKIFGYNLGVVGFLDGGNVFAKAEDIDLQKLRATAGFGVRFDSPLGPLRLDFGFKRDRRTFGGKLERGWEYHLSFGQAF